jgi:hypothetical protein
MPSEGLTKTKNIMAPRAQTMDPNKRPMTHGNMGTQLVKLNEVVGKTLRVKNIFKIIKNHAKRSTYGKMRRAYES